VKSELLQTYLEEKGVQIHAGRFGWQKVSCYRGDAHTRGDQNPSASVNLITGYYRCFACGIEGDVYNLLMIEEGVDFKTAKSRLGGDKHKKHKEETWL